MNDLTPFQEKLSTAYAIVFIVFLFSLVIYWIIVDICNDYYEKKYIQTLNEHDKSIIATYKAQKKIYPRSFKEKNKHDPNNSNNSTSNN